MDIKLKFTIIFGGHLLLFFIVMFWDKLVSKLGIVFLGGMATLFVVSAIWCVNHGIKSSLIHQTGKVCIDITGVATASVFSSLIIGRGKIKRIVPVLCAAIISGVLVGIMRWHLHTLKIRIFQIM